MARFPSIDTTGQFEAPEVRDQIRNLAEPLVNDAVDQVNTAYGQLPDQVTALQHTMLPRAEAETYGIAGPEGPAPVIEAGVTEQVDAGQPAQVTVTRIGEAHYRVDHRIPRGPAAQGSDLDDNSIASQINTAGTATRAALGAHFVGSSAFRHIVAVEEGDPLPVLPDDGLIIQYRTADDFFEDFATGMDGLTQRFNPGGWEIVEDPTALNGYALQLPSVGSSASRRGMSLDAADNALGLPDVEIVGRTNYLAHHTQYGSALMVRGTGDAGAETGIAAGLQANTLRLFRFTNGGSGTVGSYSFETQARTWYWIRLRVIGTHVQARVWSEYETEPDTWHVDEPTGAGVVTESGWSGVYSNSNVAQQWDVIGVATNGRTAPTERGS